jgi:hypothetical protein
MGEGMAFVELPSGEALGDQQGAEVTRQGRTQLIVLAGPSGSGKTTIITSLFEAFLNAPFGKFLFAGSRTLVGFERRCHDARISSGRPVPHTVHTPVETTDFLHLKLASPGPRMIGPENLLLADVSGERFRELRDSSDAVKNMGMLRRVDHLCIVLDGEKLADPQDRYSARSDARMLLRCIAQEGVLPAGCKIEVVFSKWDLLVSEAGSSAPVPFVEDTKQAIRKIAADLSPVEFFQVAARPENPRLPFAFGLPTLLRAWLERPTARKMKLYMPRIEGDERDFLRFAKTVARANSLEDHYDVEWV